MVESNETGGSVLCGHAPGPATEKLKMNADREQLIAARAYQLWEEEGRPHGAHQRHWEQATREIDAGEPKRPSVRSKTKTAKPETKLAAPAKPLQARAKSAAKPKAKTTAPARTENEGSTQGAVAEPARQPTGRRSHLN